MTTVEITARDVANGVRGSEVHCPVALALCRATGKNWLVLTRTQAVIHRREDVAAVALPVEVADFIGRYDSGEDVSTPLIFEVPTWG